MTRELDKYGCEYGRQMRYRMETLENRHNERAERSEQVETRLREVEKAIARQSGKYIVIGMILASVIGAIVSSVF